VALLWHGIGVERDVLGPLATAVSRLGLAVVVPDWESEAADGGRAHLLASVEFTRGLARARPAELTTSSDGAFVLAGWSRGGKMAASLALNPEAAGGWRPSAVVCLASGYVKGPAMSPIGNGPLADLTGPTGPTGPKPIAFHLVHGARDTVVSIQQSRDFAAAAASRGWPADLAETDTDHAGIVMAEYDESTRRCRPTTAPHAITAGLLSARTIADAAETIADAAETIANAAETVASAPAIARDAGR
jgi:predicted esterase